MARLYRYIGPPEIARRASTSPAGTPVIRVADLAAWVAPTGRRPAGAALITATFVVDAAGTLRLAARESEHVACAGGQPVRAAGELTFACDARNAGGGWEVVEASNQSTGYCPDPECWLAVAAALDTISLPHPGHFTLICVFRRCPTCCQINLVKDAVFVCAVCDADLPRAWNLDTQAGN